MLQCILLTFSLFFICFSNHSYANPAQNKIQPSKLHILINTAVPWLRLYDGDTIIAAYPVAVGKPSSPTPSGNFTVQEKIVDPTWIDPDDTSIQIDSGSQNPLGYRWLGLGGNYGIHGTNNPNSIGYHVSHGCIRVQENNIEKLFSETPVGTPVKIIYDRLVIEKDDNGSIVYYIYPDAYYQQPLTTTYVINQLKTWGVSDFVDRNSVKQQLLASTGEPNYIVTPVKLQLEDKSLDFTAYKTDNVILLPVMPLSKIIGLPLTWDKEKNLLSSKYGQVPGISKNDNVYINIIDVEKLFNLQRDWQQPDFLILRVMKNSTAAIYNAAGLAIPRHSFTNNEQPQAA